MNVEIGAEATLFPEKEYISGIFLQCGQLQPASPFLCTWGNPHSIAWISNLHVHWQKEWYKEPDNTAVH
jgi:hypothetical protein